MRRNVILADCNAEEVQSLADGMHGFGIESYIANWKRTGKVSELRRYGTYFMTGLKVFFHRRKYSVIVGWQQFYALIFCFFCELFHVKKQTTVVALNFTYKEKSGVASKLYRWFMRKCVSDRYMDYLHVLSDQYADIISQEFRYPRDRILVTPFGVNDCYDEYAKLTPPSGVQKDGYALAIGRSNRDYDFLIRAWKGIDYPLVIIADTYKGTTDAQNITILTHVAGEESYPWITHCGLMVIPIDDGEICSGDTVLLTAMALKRKIIVTTPSTLAEMYLEDGKNALLSDKDEVQFRTVVSSALYEERYAALGEQARNSFLDKFSRYSMGCEVAKRINQCDTPV